MEVTRSEPSSQSFNGGHVGVVFVVHENRIVLPKSKYLITKVILIINLLVSKSVLAVLLSSIVRYF